MITYFKSRQEPDPVVYVEEDTGWRSYAPGGIIQRHPGPLPDHIRPEIDEASLGEVIDLMRTCEAEAAQREKERQEASGPSGLGGWLALFIVFAALGLMSTIFVILVDTVPLWRLWDELTTPGTFSYHAFFAPYISFVSFFNLFMLVALSTTLALLFMKKRVLPWIVVYLLSFSLFLSVIDFVVVVTLGSQLLVDRGMLEEAETLVTSGMAVILFRGVAVCGAWIPYFLFSRRVRNTFVRPWFAAREAIRESAPRAAALAVLAAQARGEHVAPAEPAATDEAAAVPPEPPAATLAVPGPDGPRRQAPRILLVPVIGVLVIVVGLVAGLGAWRLANPPTSANAVTIIEDPAGNTIKHYTNPEQHFGFDYPNSWAVDVGPITQTPQAEFEMMAYDRLGATSGGQACDRVIVMVLALPVSVDVETVRTMKERAAGQFQTMSGLGVKVLEQPSDVTINGVPGFTLVISEPATDGKQFVHRLYYLVEKDRVYYLATQSLGTPSAALEAQQEMLVRSFTIR